MSVWEISGLQVLPYTVQCKTYEPRNLLKQIFLAGFYWGDISGCEAKVFHLGIKQCSAFLFLTCKGSLLPLIVQGGPLDRLAEKSSSLRCGIFRQALHNQGKRQTDAYKKRNTGFTKAGHV